MLLEDIRRRLAVALPVWPQLRVLQPADYRRNLLETVIPEPEGSLFDDIRPDALILGWQKPARDFVQGAAVNSCMATVKISPW